jgi:tetratricopeptide (TPR) repeat protein
MYTAESIASARECFAAAIRLDPGFAQPYADLGELIFQSAQFGFHFSPGVVREARDAIRRALELDDSLGEAHSLNGIVRSIMDYDWPGAELSFQRALQLRPGSAAVLLRHAWYCLMPQRKTEQALSEAADAVAQDTLSPFAHCVFGLILMVARDFPKAEEECRIAMDLAPGMWQPQWFLGATLLLRGRLIRGFRLCRKVFDRYPENPGVVGAMSMLYARFLRRRKARELLKKLFELAGTSEIQPMAFAQAYLGMGDERVFEWLGKAVDAHDPLVAHLAFMPFYDSIRDDPRFQALLRRIRLA